MGNDSNYNHSDCFNKFPFPDATNEQRTSIRDLAEQLDAHRKRQQAQYPKLTLTDMYNVLEKLRAGESLSEKEQTTHTQGLVSVLKQLHDELDVAVFEAYGFSVDLSDEEILEKLVALNAERTVEETNGFVRWLRPEYQAPEETVSQSQLIEVEQTPIAIVSTEKQAWPSTLAAQAQAVRAALVTLSVPATVHDVAELFKGRKTKKRVEVIEGWLDTLSALGQALVSADGRYQIV